MLHAFILVIHIYGAIISHRRSHAYVQIPIYDLPSVHDLIGLLVSMLMAMGRFCRRVAWFQNLTVFEARGQRLLVWLRYGQRRY